MSMTIYFHSLCIVYSNHVQSWLSRYNNVRLGLFITQLTGILIDHTHNAVNVASLIHSHQSFADGFRIKSRPIANRNRQVKNNGNNIFIDLTIIDPVSNATIDLAVLSIDFIDDDFTIRLDLADFRSTWSTCGHVCWSQLSARACSLAADAKNSESKHQAFPIPSGRPTFPFLFRPLDSNTVTLDEETPVAYKRSGWISF